jgi:hypothetical protein
VFPVLRSERVMVIVVLLGWLEMVVPIGRVSQRLGHPSGAGR